MNRSRPQSREPGQRSRPSSRPGEASSNTTRTARRSDSQGRDAHNQDSTGEPSTRGRTQAQGDAVPARASSASSMDSGEEILIDFQHELRKLDTVVRKYNIVLPDFKDRLEQHAAMWSLSEQYSTYEQQQDEVQRQRDELSARLKPKLKNAPGSSSPGNEEFAEFNAAFGALVSEKQALEKRYTELKSAKKAVVKRVLRLSEVAVIRLDATKAATSNHLQVPPRER